MKLNLEFSKQIKKVKKIKDTLKNLLKNCTNKNIFVT